MGTSGDESRIEVTEYNREIKTERHTHGKCTSREIGEGYKGCDECIFKWFGRSGDIFSGGCNGGRCNKEYPYSLTRCNDDTGDCNDLEFMRNEQAEFGKQ